MPQAELGFDPLRLTGVWFQIVDQIIKWVSKVPFKIQLVGRYGVVTHHEINQAAVSAVVLGQNGPTLVPAGTPAMVIL